MVRDPRFELHAIFVLFLICHIYVVSPQARGLVLAMLEADPSKRISAKDALQHPWISRRTERVPNPIDPLAKDFSVGAACTIS